MKELAIIANGSQLIRQKSIVLPAIIAASDERIASRFVEFFAATIRNRNTRAAYAHAVGQFLRWCEVRGLTLQRIDSLTVAVYIEELALRHSAPTVKQHLAAIRMCLDWLVSGGCLAVNPAWSVRGPKYIVKRGKTPVLTAEQARTLIDSIPIVTRIEETGEDVPLVAGLRDRALIGVMVFSFARVSAVVNMNIEDYWQNGKRWWLRLHEKGGKFHEVPTHHTAEAYLDAYIHAAQITDDPKGSLFRTLAGRTGRLTTSRMTRNDVFRMIKHRSRIAALPTGSCCHTFRATGITNFLENGGTIENAQAIAAHSSSRTTSLYDRRNDGITLDEIERIRI
jgi:integrase/recombinase XerD